LTQVGSYNDKNELTASGYYKNKLANNTTGTGLQEMELASMESSEDNRDDRTNSGETFVKKESK